MLIVILKIYYTVIRSIVYLFVNFYEKPPINF